MFPCLSHKRGHLITAPLLFTFPITNISWKKTSFQVIKSFLTIFDSCIVLHNENTLGLLNQFVRSGELGSFQYFAIISGAAKNYLAHMHFLTFGNVFRVHFYIGTAGSEYKYLYIFYQCLFQRGLILLHSRQQRIALIMKKAEHDVRELFLNLLMNWLFLFFAHFPLLGVGRLFLKGWMGDILDNEDSVWLQLPYSAILGQ